MRCHYASDSCQGLTRARATPSHSQGSLNLPMRRRPLDEQLPLGGGRQDWPGRSSSPGPARFIKLDLNLMT